MNHLWFLLLFICLNNAYASKFRQLYRPEAVTIGDKAFEYEIIGKVFQTTGTFDSEGVEFALGEEESFTQMESDLILRYGFGPSFELNGGLRFRQVTAEYTSGTTQEQATNSGVESYFFGLKYSQKSSSKLTYSLDLKAWQSAYQNTTYENTTQIPEKEIILGDSGSSYYGGVSLSYMRTKDHYLNASGGYRQPGNDLSAEMPYDINTV